MTAEHPPLHERILDLAQAGTEAEVLVAAKLCESLPAITQGTQEFVSHALFFTAFGLEGFGHSHHAMRLYQQLADGEQAHAALRDNATFRLGLLLEAAGRTGEAIGRYTASAERSIDKSFRVLGAYHVAAALERTGEYAEAILWTERGAAEDPVGVPSPLAFSLKRVTCLARLQRTSEIAVPKACDELHALEQAGWMEAAAAVDKSGDLEKARCLYQGLLAANGLPACLRSDAETRLLLLPRQGDGLLGAVYAALSAEDYSRALELLDHSGAAELVSNQPLDATALPLWFARVRASAMLHRIDGFQEDLTASLPLPGSGVSNDIACMWTEAAFALERGGYAQAARLFYERLLPEEGVPGPVRTNLHYRLGIVLDSLMEWRQAMEQYQLAIASPYPFPAAQTDALMKLAEMFYAMENYEQALAGFAELRSLAELAPDSRARAQLRFATCLLRLGRATEAETELQVCRLPGKGAQTEFEVKADLLLVEVYERRKDWRSARECMLRVVNNPASEPITKAAALSKLRSMKK